MLIYKVEYQQYPDGTHICIAKENGDWVADCGLEGNKECEDNARLMVKKLNYAREYLNREVT